MSPGPFVRSQTKVSKRVGSGDGTVRPSSRSTLGHSGSESPRRTTPISGPRGTGAITSVTSTVPTHHPPPPQAPSGKRPRTSSSLGSTDGGGVTSTGPCDAVGRGVSDPLLPHLIPRGSRTDQDCGWGLDTFSGSVYLRSIPSCTRGLSLEGVYLSTCRDRSSSLLETTRSPESSSARGTSIEPPSDPATTVCSRA